jgi:hypothetical protein
VGVVEQLFWRFRLILFICQFPSQSNPSTNPEDFK